MKAKQRGGRSTPCNTNESEKYLGLDDRKEYPTGRVNQCQ